MAVIPVGLAEIKLSNNAQDILVAYGLGSCVGILVYDPIQKIGALAHVLLPDSALEKTPIISNPWKYANTAVPLLFKELEKMGGGRVRYIIKIAGGAQMFNMGNTNTGLNIGAKNVMAVKKSLGEAGAHNFAENTGGTQGKTIKLYMINGKMTYKVASEGEVLF